MSSNTDRFESIVKNHVERWLNAQHLLLKGVIDKIAAEITPVAINEVSDQMYLRENSVERRDAINSAIATLSDCQDWFDQHTRTEGMIDDEFGKPSEMKALCSAALGKLNGIPF